MAAGQPFAVTCVGPITEFTKLEIMNPRTVTCGEVRDDPYYCDAAVDSTCVHASQLICGLLAGNMMQVRVEVTQASTSRDSGVWRCRGERPFVFALIDTEHLNVGTYSTQL